MQLPADYVLSVIKSIQNTEAPKLPSFFLDEMAWHQCIDYAAQCKCSFPFLRKVQGAIWFVSIPKGSQLLIEERLNREKIRAAVLDRELDNALYGLLSADIVPIVLGGADWSRRFYTYRQDRSMTRIELMVREKDWLKAMHALGRLGYRMTSQTAQWTEMGDIRLYRSFVDETVWSRATAGALLGLPESCLVMAPEDALVFSIMTRGGFDTRTPLWLADVAVFVQQDAAGKFKADWKQILALCQKQSIVGACWSTLEFLKVCWDVPVSDWIRSLIIKNVGPVRKLWVKTKMAENHWFPEVQKPVRLLRPDGPWQTLRATINL